jgi:hypothetical protein
MRVAYIILTCKAYWETRAVWQKNTVFSSVPLEDVYYLGHAMKPDERLFSWGAGDDYLSLPYKFADFFKYSQLDYDWFVLIDDDTYLYVDRLLSRLKLLDPTSMYMEGHVLTHVAHTEWGSYHSGGAGTVLSKPVYLHIQRMLRSIPYEYRSPHWCADICLGLWGKSILGIQFIHCSEYHTDMYQKGRDNPQTAITFHHLKTEEEYRICHSLSQN